MKVSFLADLVGGERISIQFSSFVEDPGKRRLAFLLQDTNVFSEQDIEIRQKPAEINSIK